MYKTSKYDHKQRATSKLSNQTDNKIRICEFSPGKIFLQKPEQELILLCVHADICVQLHAHATMHQRGGQRKTSGPAL